MILGMSIATFTLVHTVLSLVGIVAGLVAAGAIATGTRLDRWAAVFLVTNVLGVVLATYLNVFVLVAQLFKRIPVLFLLAPTQSEPPFALTQGLVLVLFVWLGVAAVKGSRPAPAPALGRPTP